MKTTLLITTFLFIYVFSSFSQSSSSDGKLNLLTAPSSPGSILLKFSPSDIEKPTDLPDVWASFQNISSSFTKLPSDFAIDFSPQKLFGKSKARYLDSTLSALRETKGKNVFGQSFLLSLAVRNTDSAQDGFLSKSTYIGMGFKFSIIRGAFDPTVEKSYQEIKLLNKKALDIEKKINQTIVEDQLKDELDSLHKIQDSLVRIENKTEEEKKSLKEITSYISNLIKSKQKEKELMNEAVEKYNKQIQKIASEFQLKRIGWNWDMAGGFATEFKNRTFNRSRIYNAGIWNTVGYTHEKNGTFLGLVRLLYNPEQIYALDNNPNTFQKNIATFDAGFSYVYGSTQSKFNLSLEAIYRSVLTKNTIDPNWRLMLNADYAIFKNQKLTFSFGKNFDGTITKTGNLIAALSFVTGILNKTSISSTSGN